MISNRTDSLVRRAQRLLAVLAVLAVGALMLVACGSTSGGSVGATGKSDSGGTATFALPPASVPNYIYPVSPQAYDSVVNVLQFQYLMYRPLYWPGGNGKPVVNESLSLAYPPTWSDNNKVITVRLKHYLWSNGTALTTRDITFFMNLVRSYFQQWIFYVPGEFPANVVSTKVISPTEIQFTTDKAYNRQWFLGQLALITPLPLAWDKTCGTCATGTADLTPAGAAKVQSYLLGQAQDLRTYATNPLWQIVDGPWKLSQFQTTGYAAFVPNGEYSGPIKPKLSKFVELPYTTDESEFTNVVSRSSSIDVGYLPAADTPQIGRLESLGYKVSAWGMWAVNYMTENYNNPVAGPIFQQLYVRDAIQRVMDQPLDVSVIYDGYANTNYGPIPPVPSNKYVSAYEKKNPYPFDPAKAKAIVLSHGWKIEGGVATCVSPGNGSSDCGPGVTAGAKMSFNLQYLTGDLAIQRTMESFKSSAAQAGIQINLEPAPLDTIISTELPCTVNQASCSWQIEYSGGGITYTPAVFPSGNPILQCGGSFSLGSYCNSDMDSLLSAVLLAPPSQTDTAMTAYENYAAQQAPMIWLADPAYQITVYNKDLQGVTPQNPVLAITPENWSFTKSSAG